MAKWCVIRAEAMTCQSTQELIPEGSPFMGNQMLMTEMDMPRSLKSNLARRQKEQSKNRAIWSLLHQPWKATTSVQLKAHLSLQQVTSMTPGRGIWKPDLVFRDKDAVHAISTTSATNSSTAVQDFSKQCFNTCITSRLMSLQEMPTLQHPSTTKRQEHQDLHDSSVDVMLREMQHEVTVGHPHERRLHIDCSTKNHPTHQMMLIVA